MKGPVWHVNGFPALSRLTNFARLLLPCLWMVANGYNIFRFTLRVGRYPRTISLSGCSTIDLTLPKIDPVMEADRRKTRLLLFECLVVASKSNTIRTGLIRCTYIFSLKDCSIRSVLHRLQLGCCSMGLIKTICWKSYDLMHCLLVESR